MQIYGPAHLHGAQSINAPHNTRAAAGPQRSEAPSRGSDQLEISAAGQLAARMSEIPDIRHDRVAALKAAIADGSYDTEERMNVALDRLLDEIG